MNNQHRLYGIWRRTKAFVWFLAVSLLLYLGVSWYMLQETVTPSRVQNTITPDQLGFHETESIELNSLDDGVRLQGWLVPSAG